LTDEKQFEFSVQLLLPPGPMEEIQDVFKAYGGVVTYIPAGYYRYRFHMVYNGVLQAVLGAVEANGMSNNTNPRANPAYPAASLYVYTNAQLRINPTNRGDAFIINGLGLAGGWYWYDTNSNGTNRRPSNNPWPHTFEQCFIELFKVG
jgi:hypothetical protein